MEEDDILYQSIIADPEQVSPDVDVSGLRTETDTNPDLLGAVSEFPGLKFDSTSYDQYADLYDLYSRGLPMAETGTAGDIAGETAITTPVSQTPVSQTGAQNQVTGDLTPDTTFQDAGATDVLGTIGTLGDLTTPTTVGPLDYTDAPVNVPSLDLSGTSTDLISQGVIETPQEFSNRAYGLDYKVLDQEEQNIIDEDYATKYSLPTYNPSKGLEINVPNTIANIIGKYVTGVPLIGTAARTAVDYFKGGEDGSVASETDFSTMGDSSVDAEENQPYNQDFVTQVSGPVETNQLSMMQEYYDKPIEERIAETTGYNSQDISLAGFDLKEGATPENVQAVINILSTVGAVASLGSTEAVKKAAEEIIKREVARTTTKAVIGAATSLQPDDSSEPTLSEADQEFAETGDYDVYSGDTGTTSGPDYSGGVTTGTTFDAEDDGGSDDTSSSSSQDQGETSSDAGFSDPVDDPTDRGGGGGGGGSSGGGKIVCTMMNETYGFGSFRNKIWLRQSKDLAPEYEKGYHKIFLPLVRLSKTNIIVRKILEHIAVHRTIDIRQESRGKTHILGRVYRKVLEPICYLVGKYGKR